MPDPIYIYYMKNSLDKFFHKIKDTLTYLTRKGEYLCLGDLNGWDSHVYQGRLKRLIRRLGICTTI